MSRRNQDQEVCHSSRLEHVLRVSWNARNEAATDGNDDDDDDAARPAEVGGVFGMFGMGSGPLSSQTVFYKHFNLTKPNTDARRRQIVRQKKIIVRKLMSDYKSTFSPNRFATAQRAWLDSGVGLAVLLLISPLPTRKIVAHAVTNFHDDLEGAPAKKTGGGEARYSAGETFGQITDNVNHVIAQAVRGVLDQFVQMPQEQTRKQK